jgi:tetratricopeptide (TPR) repeat protein
LIFGAASGTVSARLVQGEPMNAIIRSGLAIAALALATLPASAQQLELPRPSPNAKVSQFIGVTEVTVDYSSPGVKNRKIWGAVVPYDKVWRAGANSATKITFSKDVTVDGKPLAAGSYAFFVIPTASKWTMIFNKDPKNAGIFGYNKADDVLRVDVKPQPAPMRERLVYQFSNFNDAGGSLDLEWEKVRASLPIKVKTDEQVAASIKGLQNGGWSPWANAARYELEKKHIDEAMALVEKSIEIKETWLNDFVKAQLLAARGNYKEALPLAQKAKELGDKEGENFFMKAEVEGALKAWKSKS